MRLMLTFRIPPEEGNAALKDGRFTPTLQSIMEDLQPEAAYFGTIAGARGGYLVVNIDDAPELLCLCGTPFPRTGRDRPNPPRLYPRRGAQGSGNNGASDAEVRLGQFQVYEPSRDILTTVGAPALS
jgi:hypothetical protein